MKRYAFLFLLPFIFTSCKNDEPELADKFEGSFYRQESSKDALVTTEWKISKSSADRVNIAITVTTDYEASNKKDEYYISSINSVLVKSGNMLYLNNPYTYQGEKYWIDGNGILSGNSLKFDIKITDSSGNSDNGSFDFIKH